MTQKTAGSALEATVIGWSTAPKRPGMTPCNKVQFYLFAKSPSLLVNLFPKNSKTVFFKCSRTSRWIIHVIVNWIAKLGSKLQWLNRRIFTYDAKHLRFENNALKKLFSRNLCGELDASLPVIDSQEIQTEANDFAKLKKANFWTGISNDGSVYFTRNYFSSEHLELNITNFYWHKLQRSRR